MQIKLIPTWDDEIENPDWLTEPITAEVPDDTTAVQYRGRCFKRTGDFLMTDPPIYKFVLVDEIFPHVVVIPERTAVAF